MSLDSQNQYAYERRVLRARSSNDLGSPDVLKKMLTTSDKRYNVHGEHEIVQGMEGPGRMFELTAALVRRGYTDEQVRLVFGGNWARVLGDIWRG